MLKTRKTPYVKNSDLSCNFVCEFLPFLIGQRKASFFLLFSWICGKNIIQNWRWCQNQRKIICYLLICSSCKSAKIDKLAVVLCGIPPCPKFTHFTLQTTSLSIFALHVSILHLMQVYALLKIESFPPIITEREKKYIANGYGALVCFYYSIFVSHAVGNTQQVKISIQLISK